MPPLSCPVPSLNWVSTQLSIHSNPPPVLWIHTLSVMFTTIPPLPSRRSFKITNVRSSVVYNYRNLTMASFSGCFWPPAELVITLVFQLSKISLLFWVWVNCLKKNVWLSLVPVRSNVSCPNHSKSLKLSLVPPVSTSHWLTQSLVSTRSSTVRFYYNH